LAWSASMARPCAVSYPASVPPTYILTCSTVYQPYISWQGAQQDEIFQQAGTDLVNRIRAYAVSIGADNPYVYLDYADKTQDPLSGYGTENIKKMKVASKKYDPLGVFQRLVPGGFKISKVA
jgi:hypothetical protein